MRGRRGKGKPGPGQKKYKYLVTEAMQGRQMWPSEAKLDRLGDITYMGRWKATGRNRKRSSKRVTFKVKEPTANDAKAPVAHGTRCYGSSSPARAVDAAREISPASAGDSEGEEWLDSMLVYLESAPKPPDELQSLWDDVLMGLRNIDDTQEVHETGAELNIDDTQIDLQELYNMVMDGALGEEDFVCLAKKIQSRVDRDTKLPEKLPI